VAKGLVIAYPAGPASLQPHATNEAFTTSGLNNVFETLVQLDENLSLKPGLAVSWHTPDDLTWVFKLRPGVRLHDGRALEARHVLESLEHARSDPDSNRQAELTAVARIEAPDPATLVIRTKFPFGPLPNRLANVPIFVPATDGSSPIGTGPYRVRSFSPYGDTVLEAFDRYQGALPPLKDVAFRVVPDVAQRVQLLREGRVHFTVDIQPEQVASLQALPELKTVSRKGLRVIFLGMDCARARTPHVSLPANPFRDVRVRQAVALALDRQALVAGPLGGLGAVLDQMVAPEVFGFHESLPRRDFDLAEARRLLQAAGHGAGFDVDLDYMPGKYLAIDAVVATIASQLAQLGVRIRPQPWAPEAFLERIEKKESSFYLMGWIGNSGDAGLTYDYLLHTPGRGYGLHNGGGYSNPETDRLLDNAAGILRPEVRRPLLRKVAEIVLHDVPVIPLYRQTDLYVVAKDLEFTPRLDRRIRAARMRWRTGS
jgi:peptide/nickel transport system substrate-binding protein